MEVLSITRENIAHVWELYQRSVAEPDRLSFDWFTYKVLGDPDTDADLSLVALESGRPVAFMDAAVRRLDDAPVGFLKAWATDAEHRGRGIATALLNRVEQRFGALGVRKLEAGWARPHYFSPGIDASVYTGAVAFLLRRGWTRSGIAYNMDLPLTGTICTTQTARVGLGNLGITTRRLEPREKDGFIAWMAEDGWSPGWQYQVGFASGHQPPAVFVAGCGAKYVGFAAYDAVRPGWFGPMGTTESLRGSGIGAALFSACAYDMRDRGYAACHIGAVGPLYFYWKVAGAAVSRTFWIMAKELGQPVRA